MCSTFSYEFFFELIHLQLKINNAKTIRIFQKIKHYYQTITAVTVPNRPAGYLRIKICATSHNRHEGSPGVYCFISRERTLCAYFIPTQKSLQISCLRPGVTIAPIVEGAEDYGAFLFL